MPLDSWWTAVDRQTFYRLVRAHAHRMRHSVFGKADLLTLGAGVTPTRPTPRQEM